MEQSSEFLACTDMPIYERADGRRFQVLGGSVLANEDTVKVDVIDLSARQHARLEASEFYKDLQ